MSNEGKSLGGPIVDQSPRRAPTEPVHQRWPDSLATQAPNSYPGGAQRDAFDYAGKIGEKLK